MTFPEETWKEIELYKEAESCASITEAVRRLLHIALRRELPRIRK